MPKQVVSREEIIDVALEMTRVQGFESVNARSIALKMGYSVQPIYSYFKNMEELKKALYERSFKFYDAFIVSRMEREQLFESMGRANIAFAKLETNLFHLLFLTKLDKMESFSDIYAWIGNKEGELYLQTQLGLTSQKAQELYIMMIIFTHGIATMIATRGAELREEETDVLLELAFKAFSEYQIKKNR